MPAFYYPLTHNEILCTVQSVLFSLHQSSKNWYLPPSFDSAYQSNAKLVHKTRY